MSMQGIAAGFTDQGRFTPENFIAGEFPRISRIVTITGGLALAQGAVLGRISADDRYQLSVAAQTDGSETPDALLGETVDASSGDVQALVYFTGEFNEFAVSFGAGHTLQTVRAALRTRSLFLRRIQP